MTDRILEALFHESRGTGCRRGRAGGSAQRRSRAGPSGQSDAQREADCSGRGPGGSARQV